MSRIAPLEAPYPPAVQAHFDRLMPAGVPPLALFTTLAGSERAWHKFRAGALLDGNVLSLRLRELLILRTCARAGCEYEWGVHVAVFAEAAKLTVREVGRTLSSPAEVDGWDERDAVLIATADALHDRATLSDSEFASLRVHFEETQILEIMMLAGFYRTVAYLANGLDLPLEPFAARFADHVTT
jgi:alkylhydroperoxidase family enzyme